METSNQQSPNSDSPHQKWARILGTAVAVVTLTVPLMMIGYYTPFSSNAEPLPQETNLPPSSAN
jgi:hypothetical protein